MSEPIIPTERQMWLIDHVNEFYKDNFSMFNTDTMYGINIFHTLYKFADDLLEMELNNEVPSKEHNSSS